MRIMMIPVVLGAAIVVPAGARDAPAGQHFASHSDLGMTPRVRRWCAATVRATSCRAGWR